ncbi:response regulator [Chryseosolibacter indicus]|uniref:Response regulator n=1 Tax=Chryseosolibacter indicus TaxID=2782351 RepID=A0ABS5VWD3_9BACT|nr:response regulator [Chryseosolibacter indicus]MBT1704311.1 response regulator [Chryseosolibacter indicus]
MDDLKNDGKLKNIILIDDDEIVHFIFGRVATSYNNGINTLCFKSARQALQHLQTNVAQVDLILLDINMPVMNGWEFLKNYQELKFSYPVYILSSSADSSDLQKSTTFDSVKGYFTKPITLQNFETLEKQFEKHGLQS